MQIPQRRVYKLSKKQKNQLNMLKERMNNEIRSPQKKTNKYIYQPLQNKKQIKSTRQKLRPVQKKNRPKIARKILKVQLEMPHKLKLRKNFKSQPQKKLPERSRIKLPKAGKIKKSCLN